MKHTQRVSVWRHLLRFTQQLRAPLPMELSSWWRFLFVTVESEANHSIQMQPFNKLSAAAVVVLENLSSLT